MEVNCDALFQRGPASAIDALPVTAQFTPYPLETGFDQISFTISYSHHPTNMNFPEDHCHMYETLSTDEQTT